MSISIGAATIPSWQSSQQNVELWVFCDTPFLASDGTLVLSGAIGTDNEVVYRRVACTVNTTAKTIGIASFSIEPTVLGQDIQSATYTAWFVAVRSNGKGTKIKLYQSQFRVPESPSLQNWADLILYNDNRTDIIQNNSSYTKDQADNKYALASVVLNAAQVNIENSWSAKQVFAFNSQSLTWDANNPEDLSGPTNVGGASLLLEPQFFRTSASRFRSVGMSARPTFGNTTGAEGLFWTPYNLLFAHTDGSPIPTGTKGSSCGFEANIITAQAEADMSEALHAFGATIIGSGGAGLRGASFFLSATDVAAAMTGLNVNIQTEIGGAGEYGVIVSSDGSPTAPTAGFALVGQWDYGFDFASGSFTNGGVRMPNLAAILWRNAANSADVVGLLLDSDNHLQVGANLINASADAYLQVGSNAAGWLFQKVDADDRLRFFQQGGSGAGEMLAMYPARYMFIANTTGAPSGTPSGGGYLYVQSGSLRYKGSSGTVTVLGSA